MEITRINRYKGALLGLAAGDALGTTVEFKRPGSFEPLHNIVGGGPFGLRPGQWTDDTSMAMCLAESLVEKRGFDALDQMQRYVRWWREGHWSSTGRCFDIGSTTRQALAAFERSGDPFSGSTDHYAAGNGSLMRLAPVPLRYAHDITRAMHYAAESSRTTHAATEAVDACRYFASLLVKAVEGTSKSELFSSVESLHATFAPKIASIAAGSFQRKTKHEIASSGYVVHTLEAALWAFWRSDNFRDGALLAVNLGDDADTTGAVYGQIAGAFYGVEGIPEDWLSILHAAEEIAALGTKLFEHSREH